MMHAASARQKSCAGKSNSECMDLQVSAGALSAGALGVGAGGTRAGANGLRHCGTVFTSTEYAEPY